MLNTVILVLTMLLPAAQADADALTDDNIQAALDSAYEAFKDVAEGANADYIPVLAEVDSNIFGIAVVTSDGRVFTKGDVDSEVSIQSIAKVFTMAKVIEELGTQSLLDSMGVDATGQVFNSIEAIEQYQGREMNPLVNPGAIAATSMIRGESYDEIYNAIADFYDRFAARDLPLHQDVYESEAATNQRNQALAELMYAYGLIEDNPEQATDIYTKLGSLGVNALDLATMAATLANGGVNPRSGEIVMDSENVPEVLAVMATAGLYDDAGKWLYRTGLPAKSGVGGGILAISPGQFGIAAIAPPLDAAGNSVKAQLAIESVSRALGGNPYSITPYDQ